MWEERPEYQKASGQFLILFLGFASLIILGFSISQSDYIYIAYWLGGLLVFAMLCIIYGVIAVGFAKTVFSILNFFDRKKSEK